LKNQQSDVDFICKRWYVTGSHSSMLQTHKKNKDLTIINPEILKYIRGVLEEGFSEIKPEA
jgi:hypothetical protein